jgi:AcrR family transcriptional regulator
VARPKTSETAWDAKRLALRHAARRCFAQHGFSGSTVERLEAACGMTRKTLFGYYPNKEALLYAIVKDEETARRDRFGLLMSRLGDAPSLDAALVSAAIEQVRSSLEDPSAMQLRLELIRLARTDAALHGWIRQSELEQREWRKQLLHGLLARYPIHTSWSTQDAADLVSVGFLGLAVQASYEMNSGVDLTWLARRMAQSLCERLRQPQD